MAIPERSMTGHSNAGIFHRVDFVVKHEGPSGSLDNRFWEAIISHFAGDKTFRLEGGGCKSSILKQFETRQDSENKYFLFVCDADDDHYREQQLDDRQLIYTHGYSWENDVLEPEVVAKSLTKKGKSPDGFCLSKRCTCCVGQKCTLAKNLRTIGFVEFQYRDKSIENNLEWSFSELESPPMAASKLLEAKKYFNNAQNRRSFPRTKPNFASPKHVRGKRLMTLYYGWILEKVGLAFSSETEFMEFQVASLDEILKSGSKTQITDYYKSQFKAFLGA